MSIVNSFLPSVSSILSVDLHVFPPSSPLYLRPTTPIFPSSSLSPYFLPSFFRSFLPSFFPSFLPITTRLDICLLFSLRPPFHPISFLHPSLPYHHPFLSVEVQPAPSRVLHYTVNSAVEGQCYHHYSLQGTAEASNPTKTGLHGT